MRAGFSSMHYFALSRIPVAVCLSFGSVGAQHKEKQSLEVKECPTGMDNQPFFFNTHENSYCDQKKRSKRSWEHKQDNKGEIRQTRTHCSSFQT